MSSGLFKHKMPVTSTSLAEIRPHNSKVDQILRRLYHRKQDLIEKVRLTNNKEKMRSVASNKIVQNNLNCSDPKYDQPKGDRKRLQKYQEKIDFQRDLVIKLEQERAQVQQRTIGYVQDIQQNQLKLKEISDRVGNQYRQKLGIKNNETQNNKKYIYHRIGQLQCQLTHSSMGMRTILCKFYLEHNNIPSTGYQYEIPLNSLLNYVVKWKLVNKLFGAVIQNQCFRRNQRNQPVEQQDFQCFYTEEEIKSNHSSLSSENQSQDDENYPPRPTNNRSVHDTWLQILKLMKMLEKMEPISTNIQQNLFQIQTKVGQFVDISEVQKFTKKYLSQANQTKKNIKNIKVKMQEQMDKIGQIQQQIKMKQELISCFKDKIAKIEIEAQIRKKEEQSKLKEKHNINSAAVDINYQKQLKEVEQAIKYFSIKKQTSTIENPQQSTSTNHLKSLCDISTTFLSPIKSTIERPHHLSPNSHVLNSTKRANYSNMKYSLRDLLSPSKNDSINRQDKKKAWK